MSENPPVVGVVVGHGAMPGGLVDGVRRIAGGRADLLTPVSNDGLSPGALREEIDRLAGDATCLVFVDLQTGSCGMAALSCCPDPAKRAVVCGVNLPMLLDFVFQDDRPLADLVERAIDKGRAAISQVSIPG